MYQVGDKVRLYDSKYSETFFEGIVKESKEDFILLTSECEVPTTRCCKPSEYKGRIEKI